MEGFAFPVRGDSVAAAVSGGSDSTALLMLLAAWNQGRFNLLAVSVNHGLRPEAATECKKVRKLADQLGVPHSTLHVPEETLKGNLQDAARRARYGLMRNWARKRGVKAVLLGHTEDDQAETFLLRVARGSGVDGLSAMAVQSWRDGMAWLRPLLEVSRSDLRDYLRGQGTDWIEDPSNSDHAFDRVRIRSLMPAMEQAGLTRGRLTGNAARMRMASHALRHLATESANALCALKSSGDLEFTSGFWSLPEETRLRLAAAATKFISSSRYRPRLATLVRTIELAGSGNRSTLAGCMIGQAKDGGIWFGREPSACSESTTLGKVWDGRWIVEGKDVSRPLRVARLGHKGLSILGRTASREFRRSSLAASPAIWDGGDLVSAPVASACSVWKACLLHGRQEFVDSLKQH